MSAIEKTPLATCANCLAMCCDKRHLNRFLRRHPRLCTERREFARQLADGTRSVDADHAIETAEEKIEGQTAAAAEEHKPRRARLV